MSVPGRKRMLLTAIVLLAGLMGFILHAGQGRTGAGVDANGVRMSVDPTVLPPITTEETASAQQSAAETEENQEMAASSDSAEKPESAEPTAASEVEETPKAESAQQAEAAPKAEAPSESRPNPPARPSATSPAAGAIRNVTLESSDKAFVITVTCSRPVGDTTYMNLNNPKRLVIDLRQPWVLQAKNVVRVPEGAVKHLVIGKHPDRTRLVVHFRTPPKGRLSPQFVRTGNTLVVTTPLP